MHLLLVLPASGCGTTEPRPDRTQITDADRSGAQSALDLLRGRYPSLTIVETGNGLGISLRGRGPVIIVDGFRTPYVGEVRGIPASEILEIEVLTAMSDTLIYGEDAARNGVVKITTRLRHTD